MSRSSWIAVLRLAAVAISLLFGVSLNACRSGDGLPDPSSKTYREAVAAFYISLAAIQAGIETIAEEHLLRLTQLVPQEPAAWANLGLLALRRTAFDVAAQRLQKARTLAPENSQIQVLSGLLESLQGRLEEAQVYLRQAIALEPHNAKAIYALAQLLEQHGGEQSVAEVQRLLTQLLALQPDNLAVWLELARVAAKRGDMETLQDIMARLEGQSQRLVRRSAGATAYPADGRRVGQSTAHGTARYDAEECARTRSGISPGAGRYPHAGRAGGRGDTAFPAAAVGPCQAGCS